MISLIGYRGTGKTSVTALLAERLKSEWADADVVLESHAQRTIAEIFREDGEPFFRELESKVLVELIAKHGNHDFVLATGGGVILAEPNREALKAAGPVIWLQAAPEVIHDRISVDPTTGERRPDLTDKGGLAEIEEVLQFRLPLYRETCSHEISTDSKKPDAIADEILHVLGRDI